MNNSVIPVSYNLHLQAQCFTVIFIIWCIPGLHLFYKVRHPCRFCLYFCRAVFSSHETLQGICKFLGIIRLFVGVFIRVDIGDDEETYSIPVEY